MNTSKSDMAYAPKPEMLSRAMAKMEEANAQLASVSDWTCSLDDLMAKPYPSSDTSIANQSSIVFTFEYKTRKNDNRRLSRQMA